MDFGEQLQALWPLIEQAPWGFFALASTVVLVAWAAGRFMYSERIELLKERIDSYREKLDGATPEQAKSEISDLRNRLETLETSFSEAVAALSQQRETKGKTEGSQYAFVEFDLEGRLVNTFNVTSITDNGKNDWTIGFAGSFPSTDYEVVGIGAETPPIRVESRSRDSARISFDDPTLQGPFKLWFREASPVEIKVNSIEQRLRALEPRSLDTATFKKLTEVLRRSPSRISISIDTAAQRQRKVYTQMAEAFQKAGWMVSTGEIVGPGVFPPSGLLLAANLKKNPEGRFVSNAFEGLGIDHEFHDDVVPEVMLILTEPTGAG